MRKTTNPFLLLFLALTACGPAQPSPKSKPAKAVAVRPVPPAPAELEARLQAIAGRFSGKVGIAVKDVSRGWVAGVDANTLYPQQSVRKLWVAVALMDAVDRGKVRLDEAVTLTRADLSVFHQPLRRFVRGDGFTTTYDWLLTEALTVSDNAANDALLRRVGGQRVAQTILDAKHLGPIRVGPLEPALQSAAAGMVWRPEYSEGWAFQHARETLPEPVLRASIDAYIADPSDGATPRALAEGLARLKRGELLSPASTLRLLTIMGESKTGVKRLRAALPEGWTIAHKTGTGQNIGPITAGYNDVAIVTAPDGRSYAVVVMIARTNARLESRQALMHAVAQAVVDQHARDYGGANA